MHGLLVREAVKLGYPLMTLRLSLAAYAMGRMLKVGEALSQVVAPTRGITAGSGTATTEMRILMIHVVDAARKESTPHRHCTSTTSQRRSPLAGRRCTRCSSASCSSPAA